MAYTKNATWVDGDTGGTLITAAKLNNIENGLQAAAAVADAALPKAGGTVTGDVTLTNGKLSAGTSTDVLGTALEVKRNGVNVGRIDNNAGGMRVQALAGTLQLRGSGNSGIAIDASGVADFAVMPTVSGVPISGGSLSLLPSGLWTFPGVAINATDNVAYPAGTNVLGQFEGQLMQLDEARTLTGLALHIMTASATGGATATLSVYSLPTPLNSATPTATLVFSAGTVATDSTGFKSITGLSQSLAAGNYLVGFDSATAFTPYRLAGPRVRWIQNTSDFSSANQIGYYWKGTAAGHPASLAVDGGFRRPSALCPVMVQFA